MARLIVKTEGDARTLELKPGDSIGIGRDADNQLPVPDARGASRKHCRITSVPVGGGLAWELWDLGATNKTRVNGKPVDRKVLGSGDVISIGSVDIAFEDPKEEERLRAAGQKGVCYLEWMGGDRKGQKVLLDAPRITMGRRDSNTIVLEDRMSSGHHAEITKDLNGYTLRDLGSTNGTLVNGEPTTEATLSHGTRIRVGNSKLVFKDPSMKDIEIELSQFEDDEGWGMMGDIDLSRARGSYAGLLVGLLLVLLAGGAGFFLMQDDEPQATEVAGGGTGNLLSGGDMDSADIIDLYWAAQGEEAPVAIGTAPRGKGLALSLRHTGGEAEGAQPVLVAYADEFPALRGKGLHVKADLKARGDATLVAVWRNWREAGAVSTTAGGQSRLTSTLSLGSGSIDVVAAQPTWAESVVFGVRLAPGASATLDDVQIVRESGAGPGAREIDCPGDPEAWLATSGGLDLMHGLTVLMVGAAPVVRLADGTELAGFRVDGPIEGAAGTATAKGYFKHGEEKVSASITWTKMQNDEGLMAQIDCAGAQAVGLSARVPRAHVGVSLGVVTTSAGSIQAAAGERVEGVRRTLAGDPAPAPGRPRTLVSFVPGGDAAGSVLTLHDTLDPSLLDVWHMVEGSSGSVEVVTNYGVQLKAAEAAFSEASRVLALQPGRGIEALREIVAIYPYIESVRDRARAAAERAEADARKEIDAYSKALNDFRIFGSRDTLVNLDAKIESMGQRYPARGATGGEYESSVAALTTEALDARAAWYSDNAGRELTRLERLADLLANVSGYEPMAAIFYRTIVERFGHLEEDDAFGGRVKRAKEEYDRLSKSYGAAIPELPSK
ncbi:MAG: FHA domain-containing protein [Planctomycetota bacterium]|nr:FHA domain-containing protein [Planctomycetota bacterium]